MAGRGGRGSALLKALEEPVRKPGAGAIPGPAGDAPAHKQPVAPVVTRPPVSGGRGSYLLQMIPATPDPSPAPSVGVPVTLPPPPQSAAAPPPTLQTTAPAAGLQGRGRPTGRGAALLEMCGPSPPRPVRQVKPLSPQPPQSATPTTATAAMRNLSLQEPSVPATPAAPEPVTEPLNRPRPTSKAKGKSGRPIQLSANYIRLKSENSSWFQYSVAYSPIIDNRGMCYKLLYMHQDVVGPARVFDGKVLFLPHQLPSKVTTLFSTNPYNEQQVTVTVTMVKKISNSGRECIQTYNVLFKRIMNILNMVQIGRCASYDPNAAIPIPQHKLHVWPGYVTTVEEYEGGLLLMCDVSHKVLRNETAYDIMREIFSNQRIPPDQKKDMVIKALIGQSVITRYNNKTYRIDDIDFEIKPSTSFERREGPISYTQYYKNQYNIDIKDGAQPMLISRPKQRDRQTGEKREQLLCLIPELSYMTGLTDDMRANFRVMKDIGVHTRVTPQNRQIAVRKFIHSVNGNPEAKAQLAMWGLELDSDTVRIAARRFEPEKIYFGNKCMDDAGQKADWTRGATNNPVVNAVDLNNWALVFTQRDAQRALTYLNNYKKIGPQLGINVAQPRDIGLPDDRTETYIKAIRDAVHKDLQLVVVLFPTKREDKYNAVKKLLCSERPCPSQMIITKTISDDRKLRSVVQKISLQINAKLGGELWQLNIPLNNTMYVGIDVYHDGAKGKGRSVAGLVASLNKAATRYYSRVYTQAPGEELISGLKTCFIAALKKYHSIHNVLPDKIIVYRDGVGDSMMEIVSDHEVRQLSSCFDSFEQYRHQPPGLVVIVVQKRISSRFFSINRQAMENPPPGTVVDHSVTKAKWYDFFLVSQHVTQGTVTPTHYVVVHDNTELSSDHLQQLSYKMCHLYYNWSGTVRVPAPCQYAHKLAYLIGENVRRDPSEELADKLYYL